MYRQMNPREEASPARRTGYRAVAEAVTELHAQDMKVEEPLEAEEEIVGISFDEPAGASDEVVSITFDE